jgi:hypothetical protein
LYHSLLDLFKRNDVLQHPHFGTIIPEIDASCPAPSLVAIEERDKYGSS